MSKRDAWFVRGLLLSSVVGLCCAPGLAQECIDPPSGLVAWWPGDGDAEELVGGRDGLLLEGTGFDDGIVAQAFLLDGIDAGVEIPNTDGVFDLIGPWTIDAWVYPFDNGRDARSNPVVWKIGRPGSNADTFAIGWGCRTCLDRNAFQASIERAADGQDLLVFSGTHDPQQWLHVTAVYDGINLLLYVNGVEEGRTLIGSVLPYTGTAPLRIGNTRHTSHVPSGVFHGLIDEVEIFDRALTPDEIRAIFEAGAAGKCKGDDADGDGFGLPDDCDDMDPAINPGAPELPGNEIDEDCDGQLACDPCDEWRNHGRYVSCVAQTSEQLVEQMDISVEQAEWLVSSAARSDVGKKMAEPRDCAAPSVRTRVESARRAGFLSVAEAPRPGVQRELDDARASPADTRPERR